MTRYVTQAEWDSIVRARELVVPTTRLLEVDTSALDRVNKLPDFSLEVPFAPQDAMTPQQWETLLAPEPEPEPAPVSMSGPDAYRTAVRKLREADEQRHGIAHTDLLREAQSYATLAGAAATAAFMISTAIDAATIIDWAAATQATTETEDK